MRMEFYAAHRLDLGGERSSNLRCREPFDDMHGSAAGRTVPERERLVRGRRCRRSGHVFRVTKQLNWVTS